MQDGRAVAAAGCAVAAAVYLLWRRRRAEPAPEFTTWEAFDKWFEATYLHAHGFAFGCTVVVLNSDGVQHQRVFGGDAEDSIYCFFSTTKIVTTLACLQLRDRGLLSLDDPVSKHLPAFEAERPLDDGTGLPAMSAITIRQCLNHTSGLSYYWMDPPALTSVAEKEAGEWVLHHDLKCGKDNATIVDEFWSAKAPALFEAGAHYNYGPGHCIIAAIVEKLSGQSFEEYLQAALFRPLGMSETTYHLSPAQCRRLTPRCPLEMEALAIPWWLKLVTPRFTYPRQGVAYGQPTHDIHTEPHHVRGDSGLKGTARDWARLNRMLLNLGELDGVRVLSVASVLEMASTSVSGQLLEPPFGFQRGVVDARYKAPPREPAFRVCAADQFKIRPFNHFPGQTVGLGTLVIQDATRATCVPSAAGTAWWCGYSSTYFGFNPKTRVGVLLLGHQFPTTETRTQAFRDLLNAAHQADGADGVLV